MHKPDRKMFPIYLMFGLLMFAIPLPVLAAPAVYCGNLKNFYLGQISLQDPSTPMVCSDLIVMDDLFGQLAEISPYPITKLNYLIAANQVPAAVGDYDAQNGKIDVGFHPQNHDEVTAEKIAYSHEFGHAILQELFDKKIPFFEEFRPIRDKHDNYFRNYIVPIFNAMNAAPGCLADSSVCPPTVAELQNRAAQADSGESAMKEFNDRYSAEGARISKLLNQYDELFADITAAVFYGDPDINSEALKFLKDSSSACRSFSAALPEGFHTTEPHCALSRIRTRMWEKWIQPRLSDKKKLLRDTAEIFVADFLAQSQKSEDQNSIDPNVIVDSLVKRMAL